MLRNVVIALIGCLVLCAAVFAQTAVTKTPRIILSNVEFSAGDVKEGTIVQHAFEFKNEGNADLTIDEVMPGCGCSTVEFDKVVAPGKTGKITIQVKTAGFSGAAVKTAVVKTNDPTKPHFELSLRMIILAPSPKGESVGPFVISPGRTIAGSAVQGASVDLVGNVFSQTTAKITKVTSEGSDFKVDYYAVPDGMRGLLKAVSAPNLEPGIHTQTAKLTTDSAEVPEITVTFELQVGISLTLTPATLTFDRVITPAGDAVPGQSKFVFLRRSGGPAVKITKIETTLPFMRADLEGDNDGRTYVIRVRFSGAPPKGTHTGKIIVSTDSPSQPTVETNLRVIVP